MVGYHKSKKSIHHVPIFLISYLDLSRIKNSLLLVIFAEYPAPITSPLRIVALQLSCRCTRENGSKTLDLCQDRRCQWRPVDYPLVMTHIAIENCPVKIVSFPIENDDFPLLCEISRGYPESWIRGLRGLRGLLPEFGAPLLPSVDIFRWSSVSWTKSGMIRRYAQINGKVGQLEMSKIPIGWFIVIKLKLRGLELPLENRQIENGHDLSGQII